MSTSVCYVTSRLLAGNAELLRQHSFTCWMSNDLLQAATDFCRHIGQRAIYAECSPHGLTRYLFWRPPVGAGFEVRSGRSGAQFRALDQANVERGWSLLSLHVSEGDLYSAVWITPEYLTTATAVLAAYGITPAERASSE